MLAGCPFIPTPVVSSEPRHELLCVRVGALISLSKKVVRSATTKCCREPAVMVKMNVTILADVIGEAQVAFW